MTEAGARAGRFTGYEKAAAAAVVLMLAAAGAIFGFAPADALQGPVQRIFYLHVSSAIAAYGCFAVVLLGGAIYLRTESAAADRWARAAALVGLVFTTVTLVMGMLWAKPIWGTFWTWDARLTSTLVLWIIYAGYLLVRRLAEPGRQAARFAAVVGIFGFIDVPVVHFSVTWWRTQHPGPVIVNGALPPEMLATFFFTMACTLVLAAVMIAIRYRIEAVTDGSQPAAVAPAPVVSAPDPGPSGVR
ncbi:cytochrome C assembly protein [bacterium]|nr:MAG: cytochrome C assembly protein [bacterium]